MKLDLQAELDLVQQIMEVNQRCGIGVSPELAMYEAWLKAWDAVAPDPENQGKLIKLRKKTGLTSILKKNGKPSGKSST